MSILTPLLMALLCGVAPSAVRAQDSVTPPAATAPDLATTDASTITAAPTTRVDVEVAPTDAPLPPKTVAASLPTTFWVAIAAASVGLVTGVTLGFLALDAQTDFDARPNESDASRGETLSVFADVGFGVAILGAVTAVVLYGVHDDARAAKDAEASPTKPTVALTPTWNGHGGGAAVRVTF